MDEKFRIMPPHSIQLPSLASCPSVVTDERKSKKTKGDRKTNGDPKEIHCNASELVYLIGCHSNQDLKVKSSSVSYRHKERKIATFYMMIYGGAHSLNRY